MSSKEDFLVGCSLFVDEAYEEAMDHFNRAIQAEPTNAEYFIKRSACAAKLKRFTNSLADANSALQIEPQNFRAYLRKGMACFELEEYETARNAFKAGQSYNPEEASFKTWIRKCDAEIKENDVVEGELEDIEEKEESNTTIEEKNNTENFDNNTTTPSSSLKLKESSIKHSWYQNETFVYVTFYAKGLQNKDVEVEFGKQALEVNLRLSENNQFVFDQYLCDSIVPDECRVVINKTNVEIRLKKANTAQWPTLDNSGSKSMQQWPDTSGADKRLYPSSSKKQKDWDKIAASVEEEKLEGEQALAKVFQDIYGKGSDEQRRAMMKSFVESGGTVLSTNWDEVGKAPVKGTPPKGLEMKKYDE